MSFIKKLDRKKQLFLLCLILIGTSSIVASLIQTDFGTIDVEYVRIIDENGMAVTGKLYRPLTATVDSPAPGVLLLHGMNNDKDTEGPAALELARRGIVTLAIDEISHGDSDRLIDVFEGLGGTSTLGANASYQWLKGLAFVDGTRLGLVGHSMGAGTASAVAEMNPDHRAIVIQAGGPYNLTDHDYMNNYLAVWAFYEELFTTQPREEFLQDSLEMIAYNEGLADASSAQADFTYGTFADGSAHRYAQCPCTHPGATWNSKSVSETTAWMLQALMGLDESAATSLSAESTQTYMIREGATLFALIVSFLSLIPLASILLEIPYFSKVARQLPQKVPTEGKKWWLYALVNSFVGGVTFLLLPNAGLAGGAILGAFLPVFLLVTGNGLLVWFLLNALIAYVLYRRWFKKESLENGLTHEDVGRFKTFRDPESKDVIFRTIVLAITMFSYLYILVAASQEFLGIEFRYMWPALKEFTPDKFGQFLVYIVPVFPFFL
ncbi:MAG: alpha/beta hydrolase, partial [Candidatus Thorarchaeota archaeon]